MLIKRTRTARIVFFHLEDLDHQFRRLVRPVSREDDPAADLVIVVAPLCHRFKVQSSEYFLRVERCSLGDTVAEAVPLGERHRVPRSRGAEAGVAMRRVCRQNEQLQVAVTIVAEENRVSVSYITGPLKKACTVFKFSTAARGPPTICLSAVFARNGGNERNRVQALLRAPVCTCSPNV